MNIGIVGHSPENLPPDAEGQVKVAILRLLKDHGDDLNITLVSNGNIGVGHFVCKAALELNIPYYLLLARGPRILGEFWYDKQVDDLINFYEKATEIYVNRIGTSLNAQAIEETDIKLINESNFLLCFWDGRKSGRTYSILKKALQLNKMTYNVFKNYKLISKNDL